MARPQNSPKTLHRPDLAGRTSFDGLFNQGTKDRPPRVARRGVLLCGFGAVVSACSGSLESISESMRIAFRGYEGVPITRARINTLPYASMAAKIGKGPRSLIVLGRADEGELHWFSADRTVLVTRYGRVVRTAGFPANIRNTRLLDDDPLPKIVSGPLSTATFRRLVDLTPTDRYGILITSSLEALGPETIEIAELHFDTEVYFETCTAREFDWSFENQYWVDPKNGLTWKSVQHIHPDIPPIELELLKPPSV